MIGNPAAENNVRQGVTTVFASPDGGGSIRVASIWARSARKARHQRGDLHRPRLGAWRRRRASRPARVSRRTRPHEGARADGHARRCVWPEHRVVLHMCLAATLRSRKSSTWLRWLANMVAFTNRTCATKPARCWTAFATLSPLANRGICQPRSPTTRSSAGRTGVAVSTRSKLRTMRGLRRGRDHRSSTRIRPQYLDSGGLFPGWVQEGGREKMLERLRDETSLRRTLSFITSAIENDRGGGDPANVVLAACPFDASLAGKVWRRCCATEASADARPDRRSRRRTRAEGRMQCRLPRDQRRRSRAHHEASGNDDCVGRRAQASGVRQGTFPIRVPTARLHRVLGVYVREKHVLTLEDAVRRCQTFPRSACG